MLTATYGFLRDVGESVITSRCFSARQTVRPMDHEQRITVQEQVVENGGVQLAYRVRPVRDWAHPGKRHMRMSRR